MRSMKPLLQPEPTDVNTMLAGVETKRIRRRNLRITGGVAGAAVVVATLGLVGLQFLRMPDEVQPVAPEVTAPAVEPVEQAPVPVAEPVEQQAEPVEVREPAQHAERPRMDGLKLKVPAVQAPAFEPKMPLPEPSEPETEPSKPAAAPVDLLADDGELPLEPDSVEPGPHGEMVLVDISPVETVRSDVAVRACLQDAGLTEPVLAEIRLVEGNPVQLNVVDDVPAATETCLIEAVGRLQLSGAPYYEIFRIPVRDEPAQAPITMER